MSRKIRTEVEKAMTPLAEDFLNVPHLAELLDKLALAVAEWFPEDGKRIAFRYAAISQGAEVKKAEAYDADLANDKKRIESMLNDPNNNAASE